METIIRPSGGKWKTVAAVAVAVGCVALLVVVLVRTFVTPGSAGPDTGFVCEACDHQWDAPMQALPTCPKCGGRPILPSRYRCPECRHEFVGIERQKIGVGKFRYRLAGTQEWLGQRPTLLTCPHCEYSSPDIESLHGIPAVKRNPDVQGGGPGS